MHLSNRIDRLGEENSSYIETANSEIIGLKELGKIPTERVYEGYVKHFPQLSMKYEWLARVLEQMADSVIITNIQGIIEYVNSAFVETTGYSREEAIGQTPRILKSGIQDKVFYRNLWRDLKKGKTFKGVLINKKKNSEQYCCQQTITAMKDENGQITHFVSVLRDISDLKKKQEHEFNINIAREIQQRYFRTTLSIPGFDIAGMSYPASETGGDYFDFIQMKDKSFGIAIGDVIGHGIGAALIMAEIRAYLRAFASMENDPGKILTLINQELALSLDGNQYVTMLFARVDPENQSLIYAGAGHVEGYLLGNSGNVQHVMRSAGPPLGFLVDLKYNSSNPVTIKSEDIGVFLTDGITEASATNKSEYSALRAINFINDHKNEAASMIVENLYRNVRKYSKKFLQEDDITAIICKVNQSGISDIAEK